MNLVTPQQADPPPVCLKTLLTWHRVHTHPPRSASSAIQRLAGGVDSWPPLWPHHTRSQTCTHTPLWARALGALDYWIERCYGQDGPVKSSFDCPARGYWGRDVTLSLPWSDAEEEELNRACILYWIECKGPWGRLTDTSLTRQLLISPMCSHTSHNCSAHKHLHTQCESLPHSRQLHLVKSGGNNECN